MPYDTTFWGLVFGGVGAVAGIAGATIPLMMRERKEEQKIDQLESILRVATSSDDYTRMCIELHETHSNVRVLSKTPGLILPTERSLTSERSKLFDTIDMRLKLGPGSYQLKILIDRRLVQQELNRYKSEHRAESIREAKARLSAATEIPNLDLRMADTGVTPSMMIGGDDVVCMGYKEKRAKWNSEGYEVRAPGLVKMATAQFDTLFEVADRAKIDSFEFD